MITRDMNFLILKDENYFSTHSLRRTPNSKKEQDNNINWNAESKKKIGCERDNDLYFLKKS